MTVGQDKSTRSKKVNILKKESLMLQLQTQPTESNRTWNGAPTVKAAPQSTWLAMGSSWQHRVQKHRQPLHRCQHWFLFARGEWAAFGAESLQKCSLSSWKWQLNLNHTIILDYREPDWEKYRLQCTWSRPVARIKSWKL